MKRLILRSCVIVCVCTMIISSLHAQVRAPENPQAYKKQQTTILKTLKKDMDKSSNKDDIALDYIGQMIAYYKAGSMLAKNVMDYGDNQVIRQVGRSIRKRNAQEVKKMEEISIRLKEQKIDDGPKKKEYHETVKPILEAMIENLEQVEDENIDRMFLIQMICYNEGIIKMAQNVLNYTANIEVQDIVQKVIDRHTKEIPYLQKLAKEIKL